MAERMEDKQAARLREALVERGIDAATAKELAEALRSRLAGRSRSELEALMDGVELGCEVERAVARSRSGAGSSAVGTNEMERLFEDFSIELKKLDEGLRALAAYANRLRKRSSDDSSETLH